MPWAGAKTEAVVHHGVRGEFTGLVHDLLQGKQSCEGVAQHVIIRARRSDVPPAFTLASKSLRL